MTTPLLTTGTVNEVAVHIAGDIGGVGISRHRFIRNDAGVTTVADCNAAGAAVKALWNTVTNFPAAVQIAVQPNVQMYDIGTALVAGTLTMTTVPTAIQGTGSGNYGAGLGLRLNWKTNTVSGRRMLKGATYVVPLAQICYTTTGAILAATAAAWTTAAATYISAMATANLVPVIWHRPTPAAPNAGLVGPIVGAVVPTSPAGLRSRRS